MGNAEQPQALPTDVSGEKWAFVAPYLALILEYALPRTHNLREVFDASR